jgi:hypothetical protein
VFDDWRVEHDAEPQLAGASWPGTLEVLWRELWHVIRDFQSAPRACTEGTLTGSEDSQYSEAKLRQIRQVVERLRGR